MNKIQLKAYAKSKMTEVIDMAKDNADPEELLER